MYNINFRAYIIVNSMKLLISEMVETQLNNGGSITISLSVVTEKSEFKIYSAKALSFIT